MQTNTFLSKSVRTLLDCASFISVSKDHSDKYLTNQYTFNWDNIGLLLKDETGSEEPPEWALRSKAWFVGIMTALAPVFDAAERLCQNAATTDVDARSRLLDLWKWTDSGDELSKCLVESFSPAPTQTSAVESMLVISAIFERAVGNVLRRGNLPVPFLLRDLLLERPLYETFGEVPVHFARLLIGMPSALNARNLVWHGFVAPNQLASRIPATLLILLASFGEILHVEEVPFFKNESEILGTEELAQIHIDLEEFRSVLSSLTVIPPQFLPYWEDAFERYDKHQSGRCLVLLLPQLELILRIGFCVLNDCPKRLLTAVQSSPHTTLDDMLVETIDGTPNILCEELGEGLLNVLFDLLQRPPGPRIRDRLGHGEFPLEDIPRNLAAVILSVSVCVAARLSKRTFYQITFWEDYKALFHPSTILLKTCNEALKQIEKLNEAVEGASGLIDPENGNSNFMVALQKTLTADDPMETARRGLTFYPATLFRPRQEIMATLALLRTVRSLCVALEASRLEIEKRCSDIVEGRLRSRQRKTLQRMVQITPSVTKGGICLVIMAVRIRNAVATNPHDTAKWQSCLTQMEKYTEKLASYAHGTKNRWEEVKTLTSSFRDTVLPFFACHDTKPDQSENVLNCPVAM